jgi:hypothetical protein
MRKSLTFPGTFGGFAVERQEETKISKSKCQIKSKYQSPNDKQIPNASNSKTFSLVIAST